MNIDPVLLMAYVDGHLTPEEMQELDVQMADSPQSVAYMADLMASKLPYQRAFSEQKMPPVPASLNASVAALARAYAIADMPLSNTDHGDRLDTAATTAVPSRSSLRIAPAWLGAAFAAGIVCCAVGLGWLAPGGGAPAVATQATSAAGWVAAAAGYQQLYSRDTVALLVADVHALAQTVTAIRHDDGLAIRIPDLRMEGLELKRVQRLRFHGEPLVQIVYLPDQGEPIALCVMAESNQADHAVLTQDVNGMRVATWRHKGLGYALIANAHGIDLAALATRIAAMAAMAA